ncbi:hypothetical protein JOS77_21505 [Chromobacterium haemolyticum]|nr:hypothetical protein JOS77_21505 [Chromobacterium haemolyticum]
MSKASPGKAAGIRMAPPGDDERVRRLSLFDRLMGQPEFAAVAGAVLVFVVFGVGAGGSGMFAVDGIVNWSQVAAYLGIIAIGACLLMIAGEFDLSLGSMIGFAGMMVAIPPLYFGWPFGWPSCSPSPARWRWAGSTAIWCSKPGCRPSSSPWLFSSSFAA